MGTKGAKAYPEELRLKLVMLNLEEGIPKRQLVREYGLSCPKLLRDWVKIYKETGKVKRRNNKGRSGRTPNNPTAEQRIRRLEIENELLKKVREELRG
jgi:transposase